MSGLGRRVVGGLGGTFLRKPSPGAKHLPRVPVWWLTRWHPPRSACPPSRSDLPVDLVKHLLLCDLMSSEEAGERLDPANRGVSPTARQVRLDLSEPLAEGIVSGDDCRERVAVDRSQRAQRGIVKLILPCEMRLQLIP